ncbi:hypothetical protein ABET51_17605 [Metabacillus fastidiosus]
MIGSAILLAMTYFINDSERTNLFSRFIQIWNIVITISMFV